MEHLSLNVSLSIVAWMSEQFTAMKRVSPETKTIPGYFMHNIKKFSLLLVFVVFSFVMFIAIYAFSPIQNTTIAHYEIQPGMSMKTIAYDLQRHNIIQHPRRLIFLAKLLRRDKKIQAGEYEFVAGITPFKLLKKITEGDVVYYKIT